MGLATFVITKTMGLTGFDSVIVVIGKHAEGWMCTSLISMSDALNGDNNYALAA